MQAAACDSNPSRERPAIWVHPLTIEGVSVLTGEIVLKRSSGSERVEKVPVLFEVLDKVNSVQELHFDSIPTRTNIAAYIFQIRSKSIEHSIWLQHPIQSVQSRPMPFTPRLKGQSP